ncbi:MAG: MATE family efflux transporter [Clostridiales bacterium]|nr:MATE family efflux transporter [Clostridiales bacterium]
MSFALGSREEKRSFYKQALRITLPIALQNLMDAAVSSADILMLSFVSQAALSASSLAGQVSFNLSNLLYGVCSAAAVMTAQYWGKGDKKAVEKVLGIAMKIALIVGALFSLASVIWPEAIMTIFTNDQELIREGAIYLRTVSVSYVLGAFAQIYLSVMRSVERVKMSAIVHCSAVAMNVALNACFIFGWGPFPQLGIMGVALATSITRGVEVLVCLADNARCRVIRLRLANMLRRAGVLMKDFLKLAVPAAGNDVIWGVAFSVYSVILGHLSSDIVAANSVASVVRNLGTVVCFGTSSAAAIILGKAMGDNQMEEAKVYARRFVWMSIYTALLGGVAILLMRPLVLDFMHLYVTVTDVVRSELSTMLYINSYYILGMSLNTMFICGLFRSGGDVKYGFVCDIISMWCVSVPIGLLCAFVLKLPEMWVYFILCLDEFIKIPVNLIHYKKRKWIRNITRDNVE